MLSGPHFQGLSSWVPPWPNSPWIDGIGTVPPAGTSPSGSVTYQVPINVYPGPKGIQPQLALAYNSSGGNGLLGMGWDISGISKIARINNSIYYDAKVGGITLGKDDAFVLAHTIFSIFASLLTLWNSFTQSSTAFGETLTYFLQNSLTVLLR